MKKSNITDFTKPLAVLIVEDNKIDRRILESMLQEKDEYTSNLKAAENLEQALQLITEYDFDVMVLDLNLPDSQGSETLQCVAKKNPHIAIVVNTGAYEDQIGLATLRSGAQDFLVKGKYTAYLLNKALHYAVERKRFELELREAYDKLKDTQSQLIHAEKMKMIGALASGVAHEVKNPLATILYGITYLEEVLDQNDEKLKSVLHNVKDASSRADRIITDLLDFARLKKLKKEKQDLNEIIKKALSLTHHEFESKHIALKKDFADNLLPIEADADKIEQVLVNLILNATHAMERNGELVVKSSCVQLSADCSEIPDIHRSHFKPNEKVIRVSIEDNGKGISREDLGNIFDPFYTTKRAGGGIGLGLSVSRNIMEMHQGSIAIDNRTKQGTVARLHFKTDK